MSLFIGLIIIVAICLLAIWFLPSPKYGQMRGCTGQALQSVLEQEKTASGKTTETPAEKREPPAAP
ncbi:hypothetical protein KL86DPRO_10305 [uncultured delta proteobacterium]|uniref:Uncharacterized protein n=1 Tax=uncultured delta proteobacterium TaxID=34034 RepID=A0A212IY31_9DELT|nr:hypothetical protein KL86DPRO_10305 [uncultured delta proteobacterium]